MTSVNAVDNGSAAAISSSLLHKSVSADSSSSSSIGACTAIVGDLCRPPTLTALPLLQPPPSVICCSDVISQQPRDLTVSTVAPSAAGRLAPLTVAAAERSVACGLEGSTLSLLGGLLPLHHQQQQQISSSSFAVLPTPHLALSSTTPMDVLSDADVVCGAGVPSPRYGVVVTGLATSARQPRSKPPSTCLVDERRLFSPLIVHRAVACPYPIPLNVVGAHTGCFIEPQRCWWPPPPPSSSSLQTAVSSLSEMCDGGSDSAPAAALQRLISDVSGCDASPVTEKLDEKTSTVARRRSGRRDRVSPVGASKTFTCPVADCGRSFSRSDELARHGRVHSGERPFSCSVCSRAFSRRDHLSTHVRTHTGEKPYTCELCSRSFARSDERNRHRRVHRRARAADSRRPTEHRHTEHTCAGL